MRQNIPHPTATVKVDLPLRVIQEISGHRKLEQLQKYLEVDQDQIRGAIAMLSMISPVPTELMAEETWNAAHRQKLPLKIGKELKAKAKVAGTMPSAI